MEQIACKECTSPDCHGCNMYRLERMLMSGKLYALMDENRAIEMDADVRPVARGKWIEDWETGCSECSACHDTFLWEDYKGVAEWNFCPNCGAKMEAGE